MAWLAAVHRYRLGMRDVRVHESAAETAANAAAGLHGLIAALTVGSVLRVSWLLLCPNQPSSDQIVYHRAAGALARGVGFVDEGGRALGWWPVGYPAALAPFYRLLGDSPTSGHWANAVFGIALIAFAFALGRELWDERVGVAAALLVALYPTFIVLTTVTASEALFMPLAVLSSFLLVRAAKRSAAGDSPLPYLLTAGLVIGLSVYVRAPGVLLVAIYPVYALATRAKLARTALQTVLVGAVVIATLLPWGFRTQQHFGTFQLVSMNGGSNLWMGNHEGSEGGYVPLPDAMSTLPLPAREQLLRDRAVRFVLDNPKQYAALCVKRVLSTLRSDTIFARWNEVGIRARFGESAVAHVKALCTLGYFAAFGLLAFTLLVRRRVLGAPDLVPIAALAVLSVPFVLIVGGNRYHVPLAPYVLVWAAAATQLRRFVPAAQPAPAAAPAPFAHEPAAIAASVALAESVAAAASAAAVAESSPPLADSSVPVVADAVAAAAVSAAGGPDAVRASARN